MEPLATQKPGRQESGPVATAQQAPREAGSEFELRHQQTVSDLTSQLHTTPGTAYQSFEQVMYELFWDGVNWGHTVAFFSFRGALCMESVDKEMQVLVSQVMTWMASQLNDHLEPWIQENGGWDTSVEFCENNTATESQKGQERFNCWSLTAVTLAGLALQLIVTVPFITVIHVLHKLVFPSFCYSYRDLTI